MNPPIPISLTRGLDPHPGTLLAWGVCSVEHRLCGSGCPRYPFPFLTGVMAQV